MIEPEKKGRRKREREKRPRYQQAGHQLSHSKGKQDQDQVQQKEIDKALFGNPKNCVLIFQLSTEKFV